MLLVVEDEAVVRDWLVSELIDAGYEVATAVDGHQAIFELDAGAARFSAVITDIRHEPGPDGWEVGRHARRLVPRMGVVYVTDDSGQAWLAKGVPGSVVVSKPYELAAILSAVSALVSDDGAAGAVRSLGD
jgi:CheY-like chemotaxis protein